MRTAKPQGSATIARHPLCPGFVVLGLALGGLGWGCVEAPGAIDAQTEEIIEGEVADGYAEAVLVTMYDHDGLRGKCSGTLLAPTVVLTAGHCIDGATSWRIKAPFVEGTWNTSLARQAEVYDWDTDAAAGFAHFEHHDAGVILLDDPITLERYPTLAASPLPHGGEAVVVGRTMQGAASWEHLYASEPIVLMHYLGPGLEDLHPLYYATQDPMIEKGDSGGPVYAFDPEADSDAPREVIGVTSATHYVFRVDRLHDWLQGFVDAAGGS